MGWVSYLVSQAVLTSVALGALKRHGAIALVPEKVSSNLSPSNRMSLALRALPSGSPCTCPVQGAYGCTCCNRAGLAATQIQNETLRAVIVKAVSVLMEPRIACTVTRNTKRMHA